jgi:hypothetical protein
MTITLHAVLTAHIDGAEAFVRWLDEHLDGRERPYNPADPADPVCVLRGLAEDRDILARHQSDTYLPSQRDFWECVACSHDIECNSDRYHHHQIIVHWPCPEVLSLARRHGVATAESLNLDEAEAPDVGSLSPEMLKIMEWVAGGSVQNQPLLLEPVPDYLKEEPEDGTIILVTIGTIEDLGTGTFVAVRDDHRASDAWDELPDERWYTTDEALGPVTWATICGLPGVSVTFLSADDSR